MSLTLLFNRKQGAAAVIKTYSASGTAIASGAATTSKISVFAYAASGAAITSGAATSLKISVFSYVAYGSAVASGTALKNRVRSFTASGTVTASGAAAKVRVQYWVATGTFAAASAASKSRLRNPLVMGGASTGGAPPHSRLRAYAAAGSAAFASAATTSKKSVKTYVASGQAVTSGASVHHRYISKVRRTGTVSVVDVSTNSGSTSVSVPSDAKMALIFVGGKSATANYFSTGSLTLGGSSMTVAKAKDAVANQLQGCLFWLHAPTIGSQTLAWDWAGSGDGDWTIPPTASVVFLKGTATSDQVRSVG